MGQGRVGCHGDDIICLPVRSGNDLIWGSQDFKWQRIGLLKHLMMMGVRQPDGSLRSMSLVYFWHRHNDCCLDAWGTCLGVNQRLGSGQVENVLEDISQLFCTGIKANNTECRQGQQLYVPLLCSGRSTHH